MTGRRGLLTMARLVRVLAAGTAVPALMGAQTVPTTDAAASAVAAWLHLDAPPGGEQRAIAGLRPVLTGWSSDAFGNLVRRSGSGSPRRVVACAMDVPGFVVSQVTDDGYLRLHRAGVPSHPLWDQFHEAQQVRVLTPRGDVTGVVAITNGHFARQHRGDTAVATVDQLWVDVGAGSASGVSALGISLLDPVVATRPVWTYAGHAAGPGAGARAGCAAVATAATAPVATGETIFVLSTQRSFGWVGLAAVLARAGAVDEVTLLDEGRGTASDQRVPSARLGALRKAALGRVRTRDSVRIITPQVRYAGSLVESVTGAEAQALLSRALRAAGATITTMPWVAPPVDTVPRDAARRDAYALTESVFRSIADLPGVPGHEFRVRDAISALLPSWARAVAVTDTAGNLVIGAGPERDSVAFIAHMDEVSFEVEGINADGTVRLTRKGGVVLSAWEGQPSYLHFDRDAAGTVAPSLRGVFVPRDSARVRAPASLVAWYGVDSAGLVARGVRVGMGVTAYKRAARLAGTRLTGRGSDDRTGSTALLLAMRRIDPSALRHRVLFVFSTREEGGLFGASAFAAEHGRGLKRVYSIDTFVSSDTPLEQPMFALTPLGRGAVLRGLDDGSIVPPAERQRIMRIAAAQRIPLQVGTTHGATDGSAVAGFGAPNVGLSWPGRYSHTPGEVLDLRDVDALIRLIAAVAVAP
ncbi:MAG: M20/M25/M40 family metallo-hydrolase [Gemmatimonadaceae bacterium]|nr:M20/M25/M40 family metallo-hydrolase [Gemmatimonadaceae bacterium]